MALVSPLLPVTKFRSLSLLPEIPFPEMIRREKAFRSAEEAMARTPIAKAASRPYPSASESDDSASEKQNSNTPSPNSLRSGSMRSVPSFDIRSEPIVGDVADALSPIWEVVHKVGDRIRTVRHKHIPKLKIKEPLEHVFENYTARVKQAVSAGTAQLPEGFTLESWFELQRQVAKLVQLSCACC